MRVHVNGAISTSALRSGRFIADGVLVADVVRDGAADLVHFVQRLGEEMRCRRFVRRSVSVLGGRVGLLFAEQADRVNRRTAFLLKLMNRLFQGLRLALSSPSVTTKEPLLQLGVLLQVIVAEATIAS